MKQEDNSQARLLQTYWKNTKIISISEKLIKELNSIQKPTEKIGYKMMFREGLILNVKAGIGVKDQSLEFFKKTKTSNLKF